MRLLGTFLFCFFALMTSLEAQVPNLMHYQGYVTNEVGEAVDCPDPVQCAVEYTISFKLYDADVEGNVLWEESHSAVSIYSGSFHVVLGETSPVIGSYFADSAWLAVQINDGAEMVPRQQVVSAAYALRAELAEEAQLAELAADSQNLGGVNASQYALQGQLFSGDYEALTNKPALFSGSYLDLSDKPALFSGSYDDLTNKPALFSGIYSDLSGLPALFSGSYTDLANRPPGLDDGDDDSLKALVCAPGQRPVSNGGGVWVCGDATDWSTLDGIPSEIADGDDVLSESKVEEYVTNAPLNLPFGTTVDGQLLNPGNQLGVESITYKSQTSGSGGAIADCGPNPQVRVIGGGCSAVSGRITIDAPFGSKKWKCVTNETSNPTTATAVCLTLP